MYLFELSGEHPDLACEEVESLFGSNTDKINDKYIILQTIKESLLSKLAFTKYCNKILFSCKKDQLIQQISYFDWNQVYKKDFAVRVFGKLDKKDSELADLIWKMLKNPKTNLGNPATCIKFHIINDTIYCVLEVWKNAEKFSERKPHMRPESQPISLDPKLARCMVNLANSDKIIDPFCGTGGILIEAGLIGLDYEGFDIESKMVNSSNKNLKFFGLKENAKQGDALKIDYDTPVVTDFPYGRNTKSKDLPNLLKQFLVTCNSRIIIGIDSNIEYKNALKEANRTLKKEFSIYIHKNLTKKILVIA